MKSASISIWFFIGVSLVFNGLLITGAGLYELIHPPQQRVVLYHLHAGIWWGALLLLIGIIYCVRFAPTRDCTTGGMAQNPGVEKNPALEDEAMHVR
jgi:cytochrome c biogenesis protein CcdA